MDIYRMLNSPTAEYTIPPSAHWPYPNTDHVLDHKTHLNKLKRIEITQYVLSGNKGEINNRTIIWKSPSTWKLNDTFLNNQWFKKEVSNEIKNT